MLSLRPPLRPHEPAQVPGVALPDGGARHLGPLPPALNRRRRPPLLPGVQDLRPLRVGGEGGGGRRMAAATVAGAAPAQPQQDQVSGSGDLPH